MNTLINIDRPCHEPLENMSEVPQGKFCNTCKKMVQNLTGKSQLEIVELIRQSPNHKICGSFLPVTEEKETINVSEKVHPLENKRKIDFSKVAAGFMISASVFGQVNGQVNSTPRDHTQIEQDGDINKTKQNSEVPSVKIIGKVTDKKGLVLKNGATVKLITKSKIYETEADLHGNFTMEIPLYHIKDKNLLYFTSYSEFPSHELVIFTKEELAKKKIVQIEEMNMMNLSYGEIREILPYKNSLLFLNGSKEDYKVFNKSYWLYPSQYEKYYIPKEFINVFTDNPAIEDVFIVFLKNH